MENILSIRQHEFSQIQRQRESFQDLIGNLVLFSVDEVLDLSFLG